MITKIGFLLAGLLVGVLVVSPWESGAAASTGPATIRITNKEISVALVDVGRRNKSPGDMEIIRQQLFDRQRNRIGRAELVCTFVDSRRARVCRGTYFLPKGKLVVGGSLSFRQFYDLAVVGGTGLYDNARGSVTVTRMGTRPVRDLVVFRLVGQTPALLTRRLDETTFDDLAALVAALAPNPYKRETIRKTRTAFAQILDFYDVAPNVAP